MPYGSGQIAAVEQLIRQADAAGDEQVAFASRMLATTAYVYGGEPARSFVTFSWCLADFDRDPKPFHRRYEHNLLWYFKYMVNALLNFPEVPLDRTRSVLDDMERRYREGGHSLQAVYKHRHRVARHLGADEEAAEWYRRWTTTPRDDLSDCAGCDPSSQIDYLSSTGRHEEAVALAEPVLAGRLSCTEQPQGVLTALLGAYLHTGRREQARDAHLRAYRRHRGNLADLWDIGDHVTFCAVTGNEARGLELVERHLEWLDRPPSPAAAMAFAASAALLLRRLVAAGHPTLTVRRQGHAERPAADVPVTELADELAGMATGLAARFDERNGSTAQSEWVVERMALEPVVDHLPLSATARRRPVPGTTGPGPQSGTAADPDSGRNADGGAEPDRARGVDSGAGADRDRRVDGGAAATRVTPDPSPVRPPAPLDLPADATPERLLDLAEDAWRAERTEQWTTALSAFDDRFGGSELELAVLARRTEFRAVERQAAGDPAGAKATHREALELYRQASDEPGTQVAAGRLGMLLVLTGEPDEGFPLLRASTDYLTEHGDAAQRAAAYDRLTVALTELGHADEALAAADRAAAEVVDAVDPYLTARVALHRVHVLELLDRRAEAAESALRARDLYRELGMPERYAAACLGYASCLVDPAQAVVAYDQAVGVAWAGTVLPARVGRARALMAAGRADEAVDDLVEAVALCVERDFPDRAAYLRWELADAYRQAGREVDAAEAAEEAVGELDRLGQQADADRCRHLLATVYVTLGEETAALALLDQLAGNLDGPDNLLGRAQVLEEAGDLLYRQDRDHLAAQRFAAAATAYQLEGLVLDELRARRREVSALHWAGDPVAALAALERADRVAGNLLERAAEPAGPAEHPDPDDPAGRDAAGDAPAGHHRSGGDPAGRDGTGHDAAHHDEAGGDDSGGDGAAGDGAGEAAVRWERAMLADAAARALVGADRAEEALDRLAGVADALRSIHAFGEALHVDILTGEVLLRLDRPAEAEPLLRSTLGGLPEHSEAVRRVAWLLVQALSGLDRTAEADALREEYALDPDE
ncbi:hypothetical protein [Plantactinospora sp. CA-290183]|uniref:hypothetical protein n=1 Tax=Plantactinospora sp. CA-290183 TaxID=3240006 RepID=UPI003D91A063